MLNDRYKGQIFGGYKLLSQLADGKGSQIYLAQPTTVAGPMVAVKILSGASFVSLPGKGLFRENFQRLLDFRDEYVLPLIDVGIERRQPYLVMEYVTGGSLRQKLEQDGPSPFSSDAALTLITNIGHALDHAHREGIVHGNLEPENILFDGDGRPLLTNFDLSSATNTASLSSESLSHYLSPEQCIQGIKSSAGDQYALASIAYELLTGRTPFTEFDPLLRLVLLTREPTPPRRINASISLHAERALLKALAKKPADRYETTAAFVAALRAAPQLTVRVYDQDQIEDSAASPAPLTEEITESIEKVTEPVEQVTEPVEQVTEPTAVAALVLPGSEAHERDSVLVSPGAEAHEGDSAAISAGTDQDLPKSVTIPHFAAPLFKGGRGFKDGHGSVVQRFPLAILLALLLVFGSIFLLFNNFQPHRAQFTIKTGTQLAVQEQLTSLPTSSSMVSTPLPTNLQTATSVSTLKLKMTATPISLATMPHPSSIAGATTSKSLVPGSGVNGATGPSTVNNTGTVNRAGSVNSVNSVPTTAASVPTAAPAPASPPTPAPAVTAPASLVGSLSSSPQALNLTNEGSLDWAEWGYDGFDHKAGGGSQISGSSLVGNSTTQSSCSNPVTFSWGDGAPIGSVVSETCNEWTYTQGNGFQFTVQGSTQMRTLRVYVGIGSAQGVFTATCSDGKGGTLQYRDTSLVNYSGQANGVYTLSYRTPSPGQSLTVTFTILSVQNNAGAIDLEAATLQ